MIDLTQLGIVTSPFGQRNTGIKGASTNHKGIDIVLSNYNIPAALGGTVLETGTNASAGNYIKIQQTDGTTASYMHLKQLPKWKKGDTITEGATVGIMGTTGISSGDHLHYAVQTSDGNYIDPAKYLSGGISTLNNFSVTPAFTTTSTTDESILSKVVKFLAILLLLFVAIFLFMKAFDIKI